MKIKILLMLALCMHFIENIDAAACTNKLTRQIVIDIFCSLTTCCDELKQLTRSCDPIFIKQVDVGTTGTTITSPGVYFLFEDINFAPGSPATAITIDSDNVLLDLQCAGLTQTNTTTPVNGIRIVSGRNNIIVRNGLIRNFTGDGILIEDDTSRITCADIKIRLCTRGVALEGSAPNPITNIELLNLDLTSNVTAIAYYFTQAGLVRKCETLGSVNAGYDIRTSFSNKFIECFARDVESSINSYGVFVDGGAQNIFENWRIEGISSSSTFTGNTATGFLIGANEDELTLKHSQIHNCLTTSSAQPFGIQMLYSFTALFDAPFPTFSQIQTNQVTWSASNRYLAIAGLGDGLTNQVRVLELVNELGTLPPVASYAYDAGLQVFSVSWSPDNLYLALGGQGNEPGMEIRILTFNGTSLILTAFFHTGGETTNSVDWSPDGRYIALGTSFNAGDDEIIVLEFTGSSLIRVASFNHDGFIFSVNWSPDGEFLAVSGNTGFDGNQVRVLQFTGNALNDVADFNHGDQINSVSWSLDGRFLSIAGLAGTGGFTNRVLEFTGITLNDVADFNHGATLQSTSWSPDGKLVSIAGDIGTGGFNIRALTFTGNSLLTKANFTQGTLVRSIEWSPTGQYLGIGFNDSVAVLSGLQFPQNCTIVDNLITGVNGVPLAAGLPGVSNGRGLSASSGTNLIEKNTAFDNDINYVFATNIFQQFLVNVKSEVPSVIQNLSFPPL